MTTNNEHPLTQDTPTPDAPASDNLTLNRIAALVEGLLFVADQPVSIAELAKTLDVSANKIEKALAQLSESYQGRCLQIQQHGRQVQLATTPDATEYIERFLGLSLSSKLSTAALEVLGIVAYKQPITRPEIEAIRGVNSDSVLRNLLSKGLIEEVGRLDTVGHPIQYGTTFEFLKYFGLTSLDQLPELKMEEIGVADGAGGVEGVPPSSPPSHAPDDTEGVIEEEERG